MTRDRTGTGIVSEFIALIAFLLILTAVLLLDQVFGRVAEGKQSFSGGLVAESISMRGDKIQPAGSVYRFLQ